MKDFKKPNESSGEQKGWSPLQDMLLTLLGWGIDTSSNSSNHEP